MGRVITQKMRHIWHTPVNAEQYLRDQLNKSMTQTPVTSWNTGPKFPDTEYSLCMNSYMSPSKYTKHTNDNDCSIENHDSTGTQQDNAEANNVIVQGAC